MKIKKQRKLRLDLINILSDPDLIVEGFASDHETEIRKDNPAEGWSQMSRKLTGRTTYTITIFDPNLL